MINIIFISLFGKNVYYLFNICEINHLYLEGTYNYYGFNLNMLRQVNQLFKLRINFVKINVLKIHFSVYLLKWKIIWMINVNLINEHSLEKTYKTHCSLIDVYNFISLFCELSDNWLGKWYTNMRFKCIMKKYSRNTNNGSVQSIPY